MSACIMHSRVQICSIACAENRVSSASYTGKCLTDAVANGGPVTSSKRQQDPGLSCPLSTA